jgi:asparagine synthase (glutamine-hydrolysing)
MPGIVGLITKMPREQAERQLQRMVDALRHESFYETGTWIDESLGVYVGWTVLKNSFADCMPLHNERGDVSLVFSGEEYRDPETARGLKERGHLLDLDGPAYLVHIYEEDESFPAGLNGMFHGLLIDCTRGTTTIFNDRYGMHRLYYYESKDAFYFAAEAKAILAVCPELRRPDPQGLGEFVALSCILEDRTIFTGIKAIPAASTWIFRSGSISQKRVYFQPREWEQQPPLEEGVYYQELRRVLSRNLPLYFAGHDRIGVALTGGLDTRVILAWRRPTPGSLPCYTFGGMFRDSQDVRIARRVAELCQQTHVVITVGDEFLKQFPHYAERSVYLTEGGVDLSRASDLYVSEKVRQIAPVKVVGTYSSEVIRQAVMFKPMAPARGLLCPELLAQVHRAGETYADHRREHPVTFVAFRQSPWYHHGVLGLEQTQLTVRSPFLDSDFVRTVYRAPTSTATNGDVRLRLIRDGSPSLARIPSDRGVGGNSGPVLSALARAFLEFTFKAEYGYDEGMPQWVSQIDHLFSPLHFERIFLGRHKFLHYRVWFRDTLSQYVREILLDSRTLSRPYIERKVFSEIVQSHLDGHRNYTTEIHKMLTLELLHRLFFDSR